MCAAAHWCCICIGVHYPQSYMCQNKTLPCCRMPKQSHAYLECAFDQTGYYCMIHFRMNGRRRWPAAIECLWKSQAASGHWVVLYSSSKAEGVIYSSSGPWTKSQAGVLLKGKDMCTLRRVLLWCTLSQLPLDTWQRKVTSCKDWCQQRRQAASGQKLYSSSKGVWKCLLTWQGHVNT